MRRRGFASLAGLGLLALVAAATAALAQRFADDARQTIDHATDAQLRQLLVAAAVAAKQDDVTLALPAELADDFTVRIDESIEGDRRTVTIAADGLHQTERQVLMYTRQASDWRLEQVQLNPLVVRRPSAR